MRDLDREPGGNRVTLTRFKHEILGCDDVQPRSMLGRIGGQRQALAVGQAGQLYLDHANSCATRRMRCRATSSFESSGQSSTESAVTRCTRLRVPPITSPET